MKPEAEGVMSGGDDEKTHLMRKHAVLKIGLMLQPEFQRCSGHGQQSIRRSEHALNTGC